MLVPASVAPAVPQNTTIHAGMTKNAGIGVPSIVAATSIETTQKMIPIAVIAFMRVPGSVS